MDIESVRQKLAYLAALAGYGNLLELVEATKHGTRSFASLLSVSVESHYPMEPARTQFAVLPYYRYDCDRSTASWLATPHM